MKEKTKTFATMTKHPSGLTWERWHWPFKTDAERERIRLWRAVNNLDDPRIPF